MTSPYRILRLSCVIAARTLRAAALLAAALAVIAPASAGQIYNAGGLLPAPPSVGTIVPSGPAIERSLLGVSGPAVPDFRGTTGSQSFPVSNTIPTGAFIGGFGVQPIQPIYPTFGYGYGFGPYVTNYPAGYAVFDDGLGHRTYVPRTIGNLGPQRDQKPPPPPAPAPAPAPVEPPTSNTAPAPVAVAPRRPAEPPANPEEMEPDPNLEGLLRQEIEDRPDLRASVVLFDLLGRRKAEYHSPGEYYPSSIMRLPVLGGAAREIARGQLNPNARVEMPLPDDGRLTRRNGEYVTISELMYRMTKKGDLVATNVLIDQVGLPTINDAVAALDLKDTVMGRKFNDPRTASGEPNRMPTVDVATLLYRLLRRDMPEKGMTSRMMDLMARQADSVGIPRLLRDRPGTQVWGMSASAKLKSGREVANDVAIVVASGHAYALAVYTDAPTDHSAWIGELALRIHDALSRFRADRIPVVNGAD